MCVCVCVCVYELKIEKEGKSEERESEKDRNRERKRFSNSRAPLHCCVVISLGRVWEYVGMNTTWPRYRGCEGEEYQQYPCTAANCTAAIHPAAAGYYSNCHPPLEEEIIGRDGRVISGSLKSGAIIFYYILIMKKYHYKSA